MEFKLCAVARAASVLIALSVTACGGGGGDVPTNTSSPQQLPAATPPQATAPVITATLLNPGSVASANSVVTAPNGDSVSYFGATSNKGPSEAMVRSGGKSSWIYYDADGNVSRILDVESGAYVVVRQRPDALGSEYLSFDKSNVFTGGSTVYQEAGNWFSAPILGDMGQIVASLTAAGINGSTSSGGFPPLSGALSLRAEKLAYGSPVALPKGAQSILNGQLTVATLGSRMLNMLIPSAHAQSFTAQDRARLNSAVALAVVGGVVFTTAPVVGTLFAAAGAATLFRALVGISDRNLTSAFADMDRVLENSVSGSYTNSGMTSPSLIDRVRNAVRTAVDTGVSSIASTVKRTVTQTNSLAIGVVAASRLPDPTPASYVLPSQPLRGSTVSGSLVDPSGKVFVASGSVSAAGVVDVTATAPDGDSVKLNGTVNPSINGAAGIAQGAVTRTVSSGGTGSGSWSGTSESLGACQTVSRSGGAGTFAYAFNLGRSSGSFELRYEMFSVPDGMAVVVGGKTVFKTDGLVSNSKTQNVTYLGGDTAIVNMFAPNSGTAWNFTLGCGQ